jgi:hypothetical protein
MRLPTRSLLIVAINVLERGRDWPASFDRQRRFPCTKSSMLLDEEFEMSMTLTAKFDTRRAADMAVERLVQQFAIERTSIFVAADGADNTAGETSAGADQAAGAPSPASRDDAELNGQVVVSVDFEDEAAADEVRAAFAEFDADGITQS